MAAWQAPQALLPTKSAPKQADRASRRSANRRGIIRMISSPAISTSKEMVRPSEGRLSYGHRETKTYWRLIGLTAYQHGKLSPTMTRRQFTTLLAASPGLRAQDVWPNPVVDCHHHIRRGIEPNILHLNGCGISNAMLLARFNSAGDI